jgi:small lipoprotein (TIGR04454 family)
VNRLSLLAISWLLVACGHPATVAECEEIVDTVVRLELRAADASVPVAEEVRAAKLTMKDDIMKRCVGRRITDGAMQCIRSAKTAEEVETTCFD